MVDIFYRPVVGVVMCNNPVKGQQSHTLQDKYLNAVLDAGGLPIALPHALAEPELLAGVMPLLDGVLLPGSPVICSRTIMVKTAMSLPPIPGEIF